MKVNAADRIIVALDHPHDLENPDRAIEVKDAIDIVQKLEGLVSFFKVGWPLFLAKGGEAIIGELVKQGKRVFLDLKYGDIPETVKRLMQRVAAGGAEFVTLNASTRAVRAAVEARDAICGSKLKILRVTLLTSLDDSDLKMTGYAISAKDYVLRIARTGLKAGCDGIICSAGEAGEVRKQVGTDFLIVTPGIRPAGMDTDDHKRSATPKEAVMAGADYLVVGRPITRSADLRAAASQIIEEIQAAFDALA
ncbi:MAG: orotidine-5'-phosphate decarboxylase [Deltaproteobacteria bacterium]|nr:orotidine-5'-phosphate decarboxylase [Deltaproteobacteria bacterium]